VAAWAHSQNSSNSVVCAEVTSVKKVFEVGRISRDADQAPTNPGISDYAESGGFSIYVQFTRPNHSRDEKQGSDEGLQLQL
jgi:hypothetical protein